MPRGLPGAEPCGPLAEGPRSGAPCVLNDTFIYLFFNAATAPFCLELYQEILRSPDGALVWSFLKPVLHGQILYAPNTPEVSEVMRKVGCGERARARPSGPRGRAGSFNAVQVIVTSAGSPQGSTGRF